MPAATPTVFLIRDAREDDLKGIKRLAGILNTVNLPHDGKVLRKLLRQSEDSFRGRIKDPFKREYLFVMENPETGRVVGTCQILAQHGSRDSPHIYFDVLTDERYSRTLDRHFKHPVLRLGFDYHGPTEIGGLVLAPDYRGTPGRLGKQLSYVRFVYMAMHRENFRDRVLAELLPPLMPDGKSLLWESLGRKCTGLSYQEADRISKENKEFIKGLFPTDAIYLSLLPKNVSKVVGEVGPDTQGVRKMLESIGFEYAHRVDPFDGGPHFEADTSKVRPVRETRPHVVGFADELSIRESSGEGGEGLVACGDRKGHFRAVQLPYRLHHAKMLLPHWSAELLGLEDGEQAWLCPTMRQVRM